MFLPRLSLFIATLAAVVSGNISITPTDDREPADPERLAVSLAWMEENSKRDGMVSLSDGLHYRVIRHGTGAHVPAVQSTCRTHYRASLAVSGEEHASSYAPWWLPAALRPYAYLLPVWMDRGGPAVIAPEQLKWSEAMLQMVEGDIWEIYVPPHLSFDKSEALVFNLELILIEEWKKLKRSCDVTTLAGCTEREAAYVAKTRAKFADNDALVTEGVRIHRALTQSAPGADKAEWAERRVNVIKNLLEAGEGDGPAGMAALEKFEDTNRENIIVANIQRKQEYEDSAAADEKQKEAAADKKAKEAAAAAAEAEDTTEL
mmetsp:Transcript_39927/g.78019  ORF Transcript_39927/g.78019 Transcript_39927/m.78019 type:complete len:318 (-) Transcript_39927:27-980(-)|eukprot:CAMPEP_0194316886 /NCGR_PEP_ID=MMETSP0171-20130528/13642_1 /TAXON_ID=218684 /ORGANISM="Corethron pennatum, Strain L29A3" /LENGTH=317 /DNA_ID=CAMNT_0039073279 /DNA_START=39 /DNA_END=992 /DNA_ORIENTATION=+